MNKKVISIVIGIVLVGLLVVVLKPSKELDISPVKETPLEAITKKDQANLTKEGAKHSEISEALRRLSIRVHAEVKPHIKKYWHHPDARIRSAAAEAAGSFVNESDGEFYKIINSALKDKDEKVRLGALRGLSRMGGETNEQLVLEYLERGKLSDQEGYQAHLTLLKVATNEENRNRAISQLLKKSSDKKSSYASSSIMSLYSFVPRNQRLVDKARKSYTNMDYPKVAARSVQYLWAFDKDWLTQNISSVMKASLTTDSYKYHIILIDTLRVLCPADSVEFMEKLKGVTDNKQILENIASFSCAK